MARYINGGIDRLLIWKIFTSSGNIPYMGGTAGTALAVNETTHAYVVESIRDFTPSGGELTTVVFEGGDKRLGTMQFGDTGKTGFTFTLEDIQNSLITALHGTAVDTTSNSEFEQFSTYASAASAVAVGVGVITTLKDRDSGAKKFRTTIFPSCSIVFSSQYGGFQGKNTIQASVSVSPSSYHPLGTALSAMSMSLPDNQCDAFEMITDNRLHMTAFRSNAAATTFVTGYRPLSTTVTLNASPNWFARNGTDQALDSIVTTTGVATMAAAGTSGDMNVLIYETNYVAI